MKNIKYIIGALCLVFNSLSAQEIHLINNLQGPTLGYVEGSGVKILEVAGKKFKDLNKNGKLDGYEDWRLSAEDRAKDLVKRMSVAQISGLMLYSAHQSIPGMETGFRAGLYSGKTFANSGAKASDLTDQQKAFLKNDNLRHVLITTVKSPKDAALWNNNAQAFVEALGLGIPTNNSSDPRHTATVTSEFNEGSGGQISLWPDGLAMAATFDPAIV